MIRPTRFVPHLCALVALGLMCLSASALADRCGGTERWFVKSGTDPDASRVDTAHPIQSSVAELNALPQLRDQVPTGDHKFRLPEETKVYVVQAFLALFKNETDADYHLVITDQSLQFTPGGEKSKGKETGTSFIAEIPDPACVAGMKGSLAAHSAFEAALIAARQKFEARFPKGKGADTRVDLPVTVTGVAFYDRQHLQTGRATNGIELHPLLDIEFGDGTTPPPVASTPTATELLTNPGFEQGGTGWSGATQAIGEYPAQAAHGGNQVCWLGGYGSTKTESVSQRVTIPSATTSVTLGFWIAINTEEASGTTPFDLCRVQVERPSGQVLKTLATFSNLSETANYLHKTYDLSQFKGMDVRIRFRASEDSASQTSFVVDDVSLAAH